MKKLILILFLMVFALSTAHGQALKRVSKDNKSNSSKSDTAKNQDNKGIEKKVDNPERKQPKDEFIDRDGDGVNDNINIKKPEVKKPVQAQPPKIEKPIASPPPTPPSNPPPKVSKPEPKETPKTEPAKQEPASTNKKSKR